MSGRRSGRLFVISGPSGVGKGTLIRLARERVPDLELAISATTRPMRPGEVDGREYHFLTPERFDERVREGAFLEHVEFAGHRYGTLRSELERPARGIVLEIDLQGARQVRESLPGATQVFIAPPSLEHLRGRLEGRGADSAEQIAQRLQVAPTELAAAREFACVVVNDDVELAVEELVGLAATMCAPDD